MDESTLRQVSGIAALDHPTSRAAYQLVVDRGWIGRDEASHALGVARSVAAFHLDKLVDAGLLVVRYERTSGRTGPGAGRPAKLYARSAREVSVSLPPRRYDIVGAVLAEAIARADAHAMPISQAVGDVAEEVGRAQAAQAPTGARGRKAVLEVLRRNGYEPRRHGREIALLNCPFHALADGHRDLVCGMNLALLTGVLKGVTGSTLTARLDPQPGHCCVRLAAP